ncbi:tail fiber domain-containing protein [Salmonella enterica]
MPIDENTDRIALEKPNKSNSLAHDVERLRDALVKLDNVVALVERIPGDDPSSLKRQLRQDQIPPNVTLKDDQGKISDDVINDVFPRMETITENGVDRLVLKQENIPPEALNRIFTVDSEVAMLALKHPDDVTIGDVVMLRSTGVKYMLMGDDPSQRTNWMVQAPWMADADRNGVNTNITQLNGLVAPIVAPPAQTEDQLVTLRQARSLLTANTSSATLNGVMNNFIGAVEWWNGSRDNLPAGYALADGQVLSRLKYPDMAQAIDSGMVTSMTDALWITDSLGGVSNRASYSKGGEAGTDPTQSTSDPWFRMPDLNGKQLNSIPNLFLMGWNGVKVNNLYSAGAALTQGAPNITGQFKTRVPNGHANEGTGAFRGGSGLAGLNGNVPVTYGFSQYSGPGITAIDYADPAGYGYSFNAQLGAELYSAPGFREYRTYGAYVDGALRPNNAIGYWIIRVSGSFVAADTIFECRNQFDSSTSQVGDPLATGHIQGSLLDSDGKVVNAVGMNASNTVGNSPVAHFGVANWDGATSAIKWKSIDLDFSTGRTITPGDLYTTPTIKTLASGAKVLQGVAGVAAGSEPNSILLSNQIGGTGAVVNSLKGSWYGASYELFAVRSDSKNLQYTAWRFTPNDGNTGLYKEISIKDNGDVTFPGGVVLGGTGASTFPGRIDATGDITTSGAMYVKGQLVSVSDRTLKTDLHPISGALSKLDAIQGYTYILKKDGSRSAGVIAQELQDVLPDAVMTIQDSSELGVNYNGVIALLVSAVKELKAEVAELKAKA